SLHHDLALALKLSDDLPAAMAEWKEAIRLDPKLADAYYIVGVTLWQSGDYPGAVDQLRQAIRLDPDFAGAHTTLAAVLRQLGDNAGAAAESKAGSVVTKQKTDLQTATFATNSGRRLLN